MMKDYFKYIRYVPILIIVFIAFKLINQTEILMQVYQFLSALISPIVWAGVLAYLLNPLLKLLQKHLKANRLISVFIVYTLVLLFLVGLLTIIIPVSVNSVMDITKEFPNYASTANQWYQDRVRDFQSLERLANTFNLSLESFTPVTLEDQIANIGKNLQDFIMSMGRAVFDFTSGVFKFIMGLILSVYILLEKESHARQTKRVVRTFFGEEKSEKIFELTSEIDEVFSKYLIGKTIDSVIIGILCYIGLLMLNVKYAVLLAIIVGVTNMIPYFGPIIGAVPAVIITLFNAPIKALWVAIFILILQQVDGNIIGPKILGDSVGMSPIWIIVAIIFGGGLFGVPGMLLGVPVVAVIRNLINRHVDRTLGPDIAS